MTTMLDKCAVAGDITQGIDRTGCWTCAITVIGGTSNTAVKLVSCDTENGEYTDFKTLISASDAGTDQYKGFVVDLHGAKKYIKVTGATMATAVFGDCDHDVKNIAITAGEVPSGADLEDNKTVSITENGVVEITPSEGKDGMKKVTATVNVSGGGGDVPTEWYLWQDNNGYYCYLPFETAPDTLDSMKVIPIGDSNIMKSSIVSLGVTDYTKNSDTAFAFIDEDEFEVTFTRVTKDVPIGDGLDSNLPSWCNGTSGNELFSSVAPEGVKIYFGGMINGTYQSGFETGNGVKTISQLFASYPEQKAVYFTSNVYDNISIYIEANSVIGG